MHLPFIQKVFRDAGRDNTFTLVPLMVGNLPEAKYYEYARILLPYFNDNRTVFIISTDFCHWGLRHHYTHRYENEKVIHRSIEKLDRKGMDFIQQH